jgi:hypothetical protein
MLLKVGSCHEQIAFFVESVFYSIVDADANRYSWAMTGTACLAFGAWGATSRNM